MCLWFKNSSKPPVRGIRREKKRGRYQGGGKEKGRTIRILDDTIVEDTSHGNSTAREVGVVVKALSDLNTSGSIDVTSE